MGFNMPFSRGANSTYSPAGRVPNADSGGGSNSARMPGRELGGAGPQNVGRALNTTLTAPRPAGPVMGPGRSYPRVTTGASMQGGFDRLSMYRA